MPPLRTRDTHQAARSLEVSTAAPPSLAIISPTPRTFTFPVSHNLSDSPPSSPSNSPFEPDLRTLALSASPCSSTSSHNDECRTPPPFSSFTRTLSPVSAPSSPPSVAARRKSSSTGPEERRPKKGDDDYVKRPENAFILFRRKCCEDRASSSYPSSPGSPSSPAVPKKKERQADLSKTISQQWKALPQTERAHWEALAKAKKREHEALHPGYVYRPQRTRTKNRASTSTADADAESSQASSSTQSERRTPSVPPAPPRQVEFVIPAPRAQHSRSASAPTPPPYQAVQIPNVYASHPYSYSGDGSDVASLMPIITRRGVGNGNGEFDYMPSFVGAFDFEANLQSPEFLRAMFPSTTSPTDPLSTDTLSPASSTCGSGPSSPYTPASASFHPSAFSLSYDASSFSLDASASDTANYNPSGLDPPPPLGEPSGNMESNEYASYASTWAASSPWASTGSSAGLTGLTEGDFDLAQVPGPELGWDLGVGLGCAASSSFLGNTASFSGSGAASFAGNAFSADFGVGDQQYGGELGMGEMGMGFDELMAGQSFC